MDRIIAKFIEKHENRFFTFFITLSHKNYNTTAPLYKLDLFQQITDYEHKHILAFTLNQRAKKTINTLTKVGTLLIYKIK